MDRHRLARAAPFAVAAVLVIAILVIASGSGAERTFERAVVQPTAPGIYVDPEGRGGGCSDRRLRLDARTPATPVCTVRRGLRLARAGETVFLRDADYDALTLGTAHRRRITLRGSEAERPRIAGVTFAGARPVTLSHVTVDGKVTVAEGAANAKVADSRLATGVLLEPGTRRVRIERNHVSAPEGTGVFFSSDPSRSPIFDVTVAANRFDDVGVVGVNARNFRRVVIEDNDFSGVRSFDGEVHPDVIRTYAGGTGLDIRRNRIHHNAAQGIFIKDGKVTDVTIESNEIVRNESGFYGINVYDVDGLKIVNNTVADNPFGVVFQGQARRVELANNILQSLKVLGTVKWSLKQRNIVLVDGRGAGAVRFEDPEALDYRLAPGSAGIDAGSGDVAPEVDREGAARRDDPEAPNRGEGRVGYVDIGARER